MDETTRSQSDDAETPTDANKGEQGLSVPLLPLPSMLGPVGLMAYLLVHRAVRDRPETPCGAGPSGRDSHSKGGVG